MSPPDPRNGQRGPTLPEPPARSRVMQRDPGTLFLESGDYVPAPAPERGDSPGRDASFAPTVAPELLRPTSSHSGAGGAG